ncbi:J domain-containing protein [Halobellus limi]|uniref:J domain-containing protein n=1 Tax=Halobellus limi TaxID=699433 RepID=A0A1H5Z3G1_9EURY|nr:J domain-containing protein [Halobellus limi]QCC48243.1 J domain-containing protein [Halobellus limi]SEG30704.1 DnaJ domain-containing protein [Halobellus limi]
MIPEWVSSLPPWLVFGLLGGGLASVVVAGVFLVGGRLFPDEPAPRGHRVDGSARRRTEIRKYLRTISEPFVEDHAIHGETVEFYLPRRDVALTFDAQAYFRLERAGTYTVLCEHEMPVHALGRRLPFDVPEFDFGPRGRTSNDPVGEAFDHLDLARTASPEAVRDAYRDRVKTVHPDHGGSQAEFKRLQEAYATAREHAAE